MRRNGYYLLRSVSTVRLFGENFVLFEKKLGKKGIFGSVRFFGIYVNDRLASLIDSGKIIAVLGGPST